MLPFEFELYSRDIFSFLKREYPYSTENKKYIVFMLENNERNWVHMKILENLCKNTKNFQFILYLKKYFDDIHFYSGVYTGSVIHNNFEIVNLITKERAKKHPYHKYVSLHYTLIACERNNFLIVAYALNKIDRSWINVKSFMETCIKHGSKECLRQFQLSFNIFM